MWYYTPLTIWTSAGFRWKSAFVSEFIVSSREAAKKVIFLVARSLRDGGGGKGGQLRKKIENKSGHEAKGGKVLVAWPL